MSTSSLFLFITLFLVSCATNRGPASTSQDKENRQFQEAEMLRNQMMGHR